MTSLAKAVFAGLMVALIGNQLSSEARAQSEDSLVEARSGVAVDEESGLPEESPERKPSAEPVGRMAAGHLNRARYRIYPGGQDEQEIKVQPALPTPGRYPESQPGTTAAVGPAADD